MTHVDRCFVISTSVNTITSGRSTKYWRQKLHSVESFRLLDSILSAHNPKNAFSLKRIHLLFEAFGRKHFLIWILDFLCLFKAALEVLHDRVLGSLGRWLLMTSTQEPNRVVRQSALCICSRKWKTNLIVPMYFGTKTSKFCFRIISFSSLEWEPPCLPVQ